MKNSFWQSLPKPIVALSPMDGVTDQPFRFITKKYGKPDLIYTEFTNVEGLCHGANKLLEPLIYDDSQRPIIAQIFGKTPEYFRQVAVLICQLGFDGIDINMGCPAKNVSGHGSGAALIQNPKLAQEIVLATKKGVEDFNSGQRTKDCPDLKKLLKNPLQKWRGHLDSAKQSQIGEVIPISIKTRIGYDRPMVDEWIPILLETQPSAIALHGRTLKQQYSGEANWEEIAKAAQIIHQSDTLILGNGDVKNRADAENKAKEYKVDGVLIGRAAFGNPFVFEKTVILERTNRESEVIESSCDTRPDPTVPAGRQVFNKQIINIAMEHAQVFEQTFSQNDHYSFLPMRKHLAWYIKNIDSAKEIRAELMQTNSSSEVEEIFKKYKLL